MKLLQIKRELGLNQRDLAKMAGMSEVNWGRVERGEIDIRLKYATRLWKYLVKKGMDANISLIDLFR